MTQRDPYKLFFDIRYASGPSYMLPEEAYYYNKNIDDILGKLRHLEGELQNWGNSNSYMTETMGRTLFQNIWEERGVGASIQDLYDTRVTSQTAQAIAQSTVLAELNKEDVGVLAQIDEIRRTYVTPVGALSIAQNEITAQLNQPNGALARIADLEYAQVTGDDVQQMAEAASQSVIESYLNGSSGALARIDSLEMTRVTQAQAEAIAQSAMTATLGTIDGPLARINNLEITKVTESQAQALINNTISAELGPSGSIGSSITQTSQAVADLETGLSSTWQTMLEVRNDGKVVHTGVSMGAALGEDGTKRSEILLQADTIGFLNSLNGAITQPFTFDVVTGVAHLNAAVIGNASIDTVHIKNGAVGSMQIEDDAIVSAKIKDGEITNAKIGDAQITNAKIGSAEVGRLSIAGGSVSTTLALYRGAGTIAVPGYGEAILSEGSIYIPEPASVTLIIRTPDVSFPIDVFSPYWRVWVNGSLIINKYIGEDFVPRDGSYYLGEYVNEIYGIVQGTLTVSMRLYYGHDKYSPAYFNVRKSGATTTVTYR